MSTTTQTPHANPRYIAYEDLKEGDLFRIRGDQNTYVKTNGWRGIVYVCLDTGETCDNTREPGRVRLVFFYAPRKPKKEAAR